VEKERVRAVQLRVAVVLKYWVETQFNDFDMDLVNTLFDFIDNTLVSGNTRFNKQFSLFFSS
jgi:hypothetical protein